jgi:hypothetical protein
MLEICRRGSRRSPANLWASVRYAILLLIIFLLVIPTDALAKCGTGSPISYDDVTSVLLTDDYRVSDGYRDKKHPVSTLDESMFWLHFWEDGPTKFPTACSQYTLSGSVGTYHLNATLADAKKILMQDH